MRQQVQRVGKQQVELDGASEPWSLIADDGVTNMRKRYEFLFSATWVWVIGLRLDGTSTTFRC